MRESFDYQRNLPHAVIFSNHHPRPIERYVVKPKVLMLFYGRESFGNMMIDEKMVSSFYSPVRQTMNVLVANPTMEQNWGIALVLIRY